VFAEVSFSTVGSYPLALNIISDCWILFAVIWLIEKEHFAMCVKCGEMFGRRSLDEVLLSKDKTNAETN
jgi:hypothetical protein